MEANVVAYFLFLHMTPGLDAIQPFVFKLTDHARIEEARTILSDPTDMHRQVQGTIITKSAPYNPNFSYHLRPDSISFFESAIEVCDANPQWVEKHLDEIGGSALPGFHWCPWHSMLAAEVTHMIDPVTETWR
jgi:hypothetical protein